VIQGKETPYVVAGSGGYAATAPVGGLPNAPVKEGDHTLVVNPIVEFGYLTITTDAKTLTITFKTAVQKQVMQRDSVTVDLTSGRITSDPSGAASNRLSVPPKKKRIQRKGSTKRHRAYGGKKR
jgi:hypothetical protein